MTNNSTIDDRNQNTTQLGTVDYIVICIYIAVFFIGVTGNSLVCLFFRLENKRIKHLQVLIFYLALSDLLASFTNPILFIYFQVTQYKVWHFGLIGCKLLPLTWRVFTSISFGIIMIINIDRCVALKHPFRNPPTTRKIHYLLIVIVVLAVLMELPYLIYADTNGGKSGCKVPSVFVLGYAYPALCIMFLRDALYLSVFIVTFFVIKSEISTPVGDHNQTQTQARQQENRNVLKMLFIVATVFSVSVFPREIFHITYTLTWVTPGKGIPYSTGLTQINALLTSLTCCNTICNVMIYAKLHRKFRECVFNNVMNSLTKTTTYGTAATNKSARLSLFGSCRSQVVLLDHL